MELRRRVLLPEMRLERRELFGSSRSPDGVETPRAAFGEVARAALEVLGLDLRVLAEREEDVEREVVVVGIDGRRLLDGEAADDHGERDGEVERIDRRFVDVGGSLAGLGIVSVSGAARKIGWEKLTSRQEIGNFADRGREFAAGDKSGWSIERAHRDRVAEERRMARFVQELEQVDVVRFSSEVLAHELVDGSLQQERVVEGFEPYAVHLVP